MSSCPTAWSPGALPTWMIRPWVSSSAAFGASRSATTTSAACSRFRARTVSSSGSPGPAPTSATFPPRSRRRRRSTPLRASPSAAAITFARTGSPPPDTATDTPSGPVMLVPVQAADASASAASTHQTPRCSAASATVAFTSGVAQACTSHTPSRSSGRKARCRHSTAAGIGATPCGATTTTCAPSASSPSIRRAATGPAPTTRTRRPVRRRNTGYTQSMLRARGGAP